MARRLHALAPGAKQALHTARRGFHGSALATFPEIPFKLADIGEGIAEVEVLQWFVKAGDTVQQFQNVCEVQSDKATVEITSRYDGVVAKVHYDVGAMAKVGSTLIDIEVDEATAAAVQSSSKGKKSPTAPTRTPPTPAARKETRAPKPVAVAPTPALEPTPTPSTGPRKHLDDEKVRHLKMMVKSMTAALQVPHFGYADEVPTASVDNLS
ncbi:hypothetical protein BBJ28_00019015 [Nothophytophthora sp. Chile5]|nr:hypothetical protein BBJ28_00019015 [Nothophytophthora sp. Chile5]